MTNAKLCVDRGIKDKKYLFDNYFMFKNFCFSKPYFYTRNKIYKNENKQYDGYAFSTRQSFIFDSYRENWYPNNVKIIPKNLELTPLTIAIWFCDDGSILPRKSSYGRMALQLSTDGFSLDDNEFLKSKLETILGEKLFISKSGNNHKLGGSDNATRKFIEIIDDYIPSSMIRKCIWKNNEYKFYENKPPRVGAKNNFRKFTYDQVNEMILLKNNKVKIDEILKEFNISRTHFYRVISYLK